MVCTLEQVPGIKTHTVAKAVDLVLGLVSLGILVPELEKRREDLSLEKTVPDRQALDPVLS